MYAWQIYAIAAVIFIVAVAQVTAFAEGYQALQSGVVDGAENATYWRRIN